MQSSNRLMRAIGAGILTATCMTGAHAATYSAQEQANMKLVADFFAALDSGDASGDLKKHIRAIAEKYLMSDYIQHMEAQKPFGPGREGFIQMFEHMPSPPTGGSPGAPVAIAALPNPKVLSLMASGDLVVRISSRSVPGNPDASNVMFNMFRVQKGKLAEHWDSGPSMPMPGADPGR